MSTVTHEDIFSLPVSERLKLVEELWDSIAASPESIQLTSDQKIELDRRLKQFEQDSDKGSSWEEVRSRILSDD